MDTIAQSEHSLRRAARRLGLSVRKSRIRDPNSPSYGGFILVDKDNCVLAGGYPWLFSLDLEDVAEELSLLPNRLS